MRLLRFQAVASAALGFILALAQPWQFMFAKPFLNIAPPPWVWPVAVPANWPAANFARIGSSRWIEGHGAHWAALDPGNSYGHSIMRNEACVWTFGFAFRAMQVEALWENPLVPSPQVPTYSIRTQLLAFVSDLELTHVRSLTFRVMPLPMLGNTFVFGTAVFVVWRSLWFASRILQGHTSGCRKCGYDIRELPTCPECGTPRPPRIESPASL